MIGKPTRRGVTRLVSGAAVVAAAAFTVGVGLAAPASATVTTINASPAKASYTTGATATVDVTYSGTPSEAGTGLTGGLLYRITSGPDATAGTGAAGRCTSGAAGSATCSFAGTTGTDSVEVYDDANGDGIPTTGEPSAPATVQFTAATYDAITLTCPDASDQNTASHSCTVPTGTASTKFTATVTDNGTPVSGAAVSFTAGNGATTPTSPVTTGADGTAVATFTPATTTTGTTYTVTAIGPATADGGTSLYDVATVTYAARAANTLTLSPASQFKVVNGTATVTATVDDQFGAGFPNSSVTFSTTNNSRNANLNATRLTGANGTATFTYSDSPADSSVYVDTVNADSNETDSSDAATVHWLTSTTPNAVNIAVAPVGGPACDADEGSTTATAGVSSSSYAETSCVHVTNASGQSLPNQAVTIKVDKGFVGTSSSGTPNTATKSVTVTTDDSGLARAYVGSTVTGAQTVTATAGTVSKTATVNYMPGAAADLSLTPATASITPGTTEQYTATVTDSLGNGVPGQQVTFTRVGPGLVLNSSMQGGASTTATTLSDGTATVSLQTRTDDQGTGTLTAQTGNLPSKDADYTVGQVLTTVTAYVPNRNVGAASYVGAHAYDQDGKPIAGVTLSFAVEGANTASGTMTTDANGVAIFGYTPTHAGTDTGTVSGPGGSPTASSTGTVSIPTISTTLALTSPAKGKVTATATVSGASNLQGQVVGFYQYVAGSNGQYTYVAQAKVNAKNQAVFNFSGLKSGSKLGYRARIVGNANVNSPYSAGVTVTVK